MEKIIKINETHFFSENHLLLTKKGIMTAKELEIGDILLGYKDISAVTSINKIPINNI